MKKTYSENEPIEVRFRDVTETIDCEDININKVVKTNNFSTKALITFFQKKAKRLLKNNGKIIELLTKALSFFKKIGNISFLKKIFLDVPKLCDMIIDTINGVYKNIPYSSIVMITIAIIYMVSPIDLLPDSIPFIGVLDDAAVLKLVVNTIKNDLESYTSWKSTEETAQA